MPQLVTYKGRIEPVSHMDRWPVAVGIGMSTLTVVLIVIVLFLD